MMRKSDFSYRLPAELIAQQPKAVRAGSRLLVLDAIGAAPRDMMFADLPNLLRAGDLLVFNDTRVIPARLFGAKETGGRVELLIERVLDVHRALVQIRASKTPKPGQDIVLDGGERVIVARAHDGFYEVVFASSEPVMTVLDRIGHVPLPPYIDRADAPADRERYQTVYARAPGAVAAPTAGLHFDRAMMTVLESRGVETAFLTLHVGAGTFQPVRVDELREHRMHAEWFTLSVATSRAVNRARQAGRRVIAVGTTVVRALESAANDSGEVEPYEGETDIFIHPPYHFRVVDAMLTNFHLPESTLLMLVCAFAGTERVLAAYRHAVARRYRFFSYGDAMFVERADSESA